MTSTRTLQQTISRTAKNWFETAGGKTRLLPMEGLRGLAVLAVFFVHAHGFFGPYVANNVPLFRISEYLGQTGNVGVDLFFLLSGFLIYGALVHKQVPYMMFLLRRVKRIYPAFLAVLSCYLVLSIVFPSQSRIPVHTSAAVTYILANLVFLPGLFSITPIVTVAWSLSFEFAFYLLVPFVVFILGRHSGRKIRRVALLSAMWVLFSALEALFLHGAHIRMLSFLSGMLLQEIARGGWLKSLLSRTGQVISILALVLLASYHFALRSRETGALSSGVPSAALMSAALFFFVFCALEYRGVVHKLCIWKPLRYWGNISYSYYLVHGIALKGVATLLARIGFTRYPVLIYVCGIALGLVASWVSAIILYLSVERPLSVTPQKLSPGTQPVEVKSVSTTAFSRHVIYR